MNAAAGPLDIEQSTYGDNLPCFFTTCLVKVNNTNSYVPNFSQ